MDLAEALKRNIESQKDNIITFKLGGEEVTARIKWNNASMIVVDNLYEGDLEEFSNVINRLGSIKDPSKAQYGIGIAGLPKANLAIIWGLLTGAGQSVSYEDAQDITQAITQDEEAIKKCWALMMKSDIDPEDLKKITKEENGEGEKK